MILSDKLLWSLFRRRQYARDLEGFWSHWNTYASSDCIFSPYNKIYRASTLKKASLGQFTYLSESTISHAVIGMFCSIGPKTMIGLGKHPTKLLSTHPAFYSLHNASGITFVSENKFAEHSQVVIGNDVWMGAGSLILGGINIGDGAVIAAGAIVTRDVEPYSVVGGIPAKLIRYRFPENIIEELMEWKWWNLPVDVLRKLAPDFSNDTSWTMEKIWKLKERAALFMN